MSKQKSQNRNKPRQKKVRTQRRKYTKKHWSKKTRGTKKNHEGGAGKKTLAAAMGATLLAATSVGSAGSQPKNGAIVPTNPEAGVPSATISPTTNTMNPLYMPGFNQSPNTNASANASVSLVPVDAGFHAEGEGAVAINHTTHNNEGEPDPLPNLNGTGEGNQNGNGEGNQNGNGEENNPKNKEGNQNGNGDGNNEGQGSGAAVGTAAAAAVGLGKAGLGYAAVREGRRAVEAATPAAPYVALFAVACAVAVLAKR